MNVSHRGVGEEEDDEIARLAAALNEAIDRSARIRRVAPGKVGLATATLARYYLRQRLARQVLFPADLFGEPAWDMLLDLYVASAERRRISTSSACIASAVAPTTALRWIDKLVAMGLVLRTPDPDDRRRTFLTLADDVSVKVEQWVATTWSVAGAVVESPMSFRP